MMTINPETFTLTKAAESLRAGEFSALELTNFFLEKINQLNPAINACLGTFSDAISRAKTIDARRQSGEILGPLAGVPLLVKDNILVKGEIASAGSKILGNYSAAYDATVVRRLREAGAIIIGRTNMDEFAMGSSTENSAFGPTKNPHDHTRVAGGSSGGSAAAVAAGLALGALGSDTGGSIRQPAAFCGVVGLKPTYGTVSRFGLIALASSLDQIGPLTKTVEDAELIFRVIAGRDEHDATTVERKTPLDPTDQKKIRLGIPTDYLKSGLDPAIAENFHAALARLNTLGYEIEEISLPSLRFALAAYYVIMPAEASSNLARFDGLRYGHYQSGKDLLADYCLTRGGGFGQETRRRIILGTYVLSAGYYDAYYARAVAVKEMIVREFALAFERVDAIITPTTPTTAFRLGERINDPLAMYLADLFTVPANLAGLPAISLPSGVDDRGLPCGLQIIAPPFREDRLFSVGQHYANL